MKLLERLKTLEPVIGFNGIFHCAPDWQTGPAWAKALTDYDLWYVAGGVGRMMTTDGPVDLHHGRGFWMRPGRRYEGTHDPKSPLQVVAVHFLLRSGKRVLKPGEITPPLEVFDAAEPDFFGMALAHVVHLHAQEKTKAVAASLLKSLLLEIVSGDPAKARNALRQHHQLVLGPIFALIRESPERRFTIAELAARTGYAPDHFVRVFRGLTGQAPKEFMIRRRIDHALVLLKESSQTVTQIAAQLGYDDLGFFSRQFKAVVGTSPDHFRRRA
jgi:AraC-like DNA-binding protein